MSSKGYLVVSEQFYGGSKKRVFVTSTAKEDAEHYASQWMEETENKVDVIIEEIDIVEM